MGGIEKKRVTITLLIMSMMTLVGCSGLATGSGNVEKDQAKSEATLVKYGN